MNKSKIPIIIFISVILIGCKKESNSTSTYNSECNADFLAISFALNEYKKDKNNYPDNLWEALKEYGYDEKEFIICRLAQKDNKPKTRYIYLKPDKNTEGNDIIVHTPYPIYRFKDDFGYYVLRFNGMVHYVRKDVFDKEIKKVKERRAKTAAELKAEKDKTTKKSDPNQKIIIDKTGSGARGSKFP